MRDRESMLAGVGFVLVLLFGLILAAPLLLDCTPQARSEADTIAVDLTRFVCSPANPFDTNLVVEVICVLAEGGEALASDFLEGTVPGAGSDAGDVQGVKQVRIRLSATEAHTLVRRHHRRARDAAPETESE